MEKQNITLSLPKDLLQKIKVIAVKRNTSVSGLMTDTLKRIAEQEDEYERAKRRALHLMRHAEDMGTGGKITWTRDELHERN